MRPPPLADTTRVNVCVNESCVNADPTDNRKHSANGNERSARAARLNHLCASRLWSAAGERLSFILANEAAFTRSCGISLKVTRVAVNRELLFIDFDYITWLQLCCCFFSLRLTAFAYFPLLAPFAALRCGRSRDRDSAENGQEREADRKMETK